MIFVSTTKIGDRAKISFDRHKQILDDWNWKPKFDKQSGWPGVQEWTGQSRIWAIFEKCSAWFPLCFLRKFKISQKSSFSPPLWFFDCPGISPGIDTIRPGHPANNTKLSQKYIFKPKWWEEMLIFCSSSQVIAYFMCLKSHSI